MKTILIPAFRLGAHACICVLAVTSSLFAIACELIPGAQRHSDIRAR